MKSSYIRYPWRNLLYARNKKTGTVKSQRQTLARKSVIFLDSSTHRVVKSDSFPQLGVLFDSSCATAAQAATVEHESDRP
jgi:hypothetical protein